MEWSSWKQSIILFFLVVFQLAGAFSVPQAGTLYKHHSNTSRMQPESNHDWSTLSFSRAGTGDLTFFTIVAIFMQHEAVSALAYVAPKGVDTFVLATTIVFGAFILVWAGSNNKHRVDSEKQTTTVTSWESHMQSGRVQTSNLCCGIHPVSFLVQTQFSFTPQNASQMCFVTQRRFWMVKDSYLKGSYSNVSFFQSGVQEKYHKNSLAQANIYWQDLYFQVPTCSDKSAYLHSTLQVHKQPDGEEDLRYELLPEAEIWPSGCWLCVQDYVFLNLTVLSTGSACSFQSHLIHEQFISNFSWANNLPGPY